MDLQRFRAAQDQSSGGFLDALSEIRSGAKRGHWMWFIFPQLYGLGTSSMARAYGIRGVEEADAYLRDPVLRQRLIEMTRAVVEQVDAGVSLETLMGSSIDALKLVSSLSLFGVVAQRLAGSVPELQTFVDTSTRLLERAALEGYPPCARTRRAVCP
jgi:uncharacterized protein (DUF1810 family)